MLTGLFIFIILYFIGFICFICCSSLVDDDVDGIPMKEIMMSDNGPSPGFVSSKWESVSPKRVQAQVWMHWVLSTCSFMT